MRGLSVATWMFTTLLLLPAIGMHADEPGVPSPDEEKKLLEKITAAKHGSVATAAYKSLLTKRPRERLLDLRNARHDGVAMFAAWEGARLELAGGSTDISRLLGWFEGRLGVSLPDWWEIGLVGELCPGWKYWTQ